MTIRKSGKIVRLLDTALENAKRTQIKLMEAQIEVPREDHATSMEMVAVVEAQTALVGNLTTMREELAKLHDFLKAEAESPKE